MSSSPADSATDLSQSEASTPTAPQEGGAPSSPLSSDIPQPEASNLVSSVEVSPVPSATSPISQPSSQLLFPLPAPLAGKSGISLSELVADLGNATPVTPDIATAEMVVAGG